MENIDAVVANLGKPRVGDVLKLVRWITSNADKFKMSVDPADPTKSGGALIQAIVNQVTDEELLEIGKILLGDAGQALTTNDLALDWMSEALAIWAEKVNLAKILKNIERVTAALASPPA